VKKPNVESNAKNAVRVQIAKERPILPKVNAYGNARHYTVKSYP